MLKYDHVMCCKANKKGDEGEPLYLLLFYFPDIRYSINFYLLEEILGNVFAMWTSQEFCSFESREQMI
jgi:hypothetical protein